jgi:hypothetical protein
VLHHTSIIINMFVCLNLANKRIRPITNLIEISCLALNKYQENILNEIRNHEIIFDITLRYESHKKHNL